MKQLSAYLIGKPYLAFALLLVLVLSSCRSSQQQLGYNPAEVAQLSLQMGFAINNMDENIPLYAESSFWLGVPYRYAGLSKRGIDCSGLAKRIFRNVYSKDISRATTDLEKTVSNVSKSKLRAGDLVFFATSSKNKINHVGIFLKDGYFIHASISLGVIVSHLNEDYYRRTWKKSGRIKQ